MSLSNFLEDELLDHVLNGLSYTPPATVYVALSTADPLDTGAGLAEPAGGSYARTAVTFGAAASRRVTNSGAVTFPTATGAWGTITHYALMDASSGGNVLASAALAASKSIISGNTASFAIGQIYAEFSAGAISDYLANKLLDRAFRNQAYTAPATYLALTTATVSDTSTGSTITEPSGNNYSRKLVNVNGGASPAWSLASGGAASNGADTHMATPSGSWGTIVAMALVDASSAGNLLFYDNTNVTDQAVGSGDDVVFLSGALDVSIT